MKTSRYFLESIFLLLCVILMLYVGVPGSNRANAESDSDLFTFVRLKYESSGRYSAWRTDWSASDRNFIWHLKQATNLPVAPREKIISVGSPELFNYPFAYIVEVGHLNLTKKEAKNLREYLLRGGFILVDDFHDQWQWDNFYRQLKKIFPDREPEEIPISHPLFHCFFDIDELIQIPAFGGWWYNGPVYCGGVYDDHGRLMMMINFNTDLGDAWEHAANPSYPREYSDIAYQMGVNTVIYALTH